MLPIPLFTSAANCMWQQKKASERACTGKLYDVLPQIWCDVAATIAVCRCLGKEGLWQPVHLEA